MNDEKRDPLTAEILPSSVPREKRGVVIDKVGQKWVRIYCANCGKDGGMVPEPSETFAFYLCDEVCGPRWQHLIGTQVVPQERFWEIARQEQLERLGREMTALELQQALADPNHWVHKLLASYDEFLKKRPK